MLQRFRKIILLALILTFVGSLYGYWRRDDVLGWYYFDKLASADGAQREIWVRRLIDMDEAIVPRAIDTLHARGERSCADAEEVLVGLIKNWKDARVAGILKEMLSQWPSLSDPGKHAALGVARVALEEKGDETPVAFLCTLACDLLQEAAGQPQAQRPTLRLAAVVVRLNSGEAPPPLLTALAEQGMVSADFDLRVLALRLFLLPPLSKDTELLTGVVPFLKDVSAEVRRTALLAVGSNPDLVAEDDLLPLLHDDDREVCRLCEVALRGRGLHDRHILLARLISDPRPQIRLEVLEYLQESRDLAPGVWLRKLCRDASPAVRAAAVRAAADLDDLHDRLRDMAQNDASETVRQLAAHYLRHGNVWRTGYRQ